MLCAIGLWKMKGRVREDGNEEEMKKARAKKNAKRRALCIDFPLPVKRERQHRFPAAAWLGKR